MALATPISAICADRFGRRPVLLAGSAGAALSGFLLPEGLGSGSILGLLAFLSLALFVMGLSFAPLGALLPELFPTRLRYTGAAVAYNLGGILGASLAPLPRAASRRRGGARLGRLLPLGGRRRQLSQRAEHARNDRKPIDPRA
jgi:MFS family permease